jgi:hypothetical protein
MQDQATFSRRVYQPSGRVNWFRFLAGLLLAGAAALVMACALYFAFEQGIYLIFIAPILAALPVMGVWFLVLSGSHCRNKTLAMIYSIALALLLFFGYYYFGLLRLVGLQNAHRVDLLPSYVHLRLQTDVVRDARLPQPAQPQQPGPVEFGFNAFAFGGESLILVGLFIAVGMSCVSRAYCEDCRKWMDRETLRLPAGKATELWRALDRGDSGQVRQLLTQTSRKESVSGAVTIECCPTCSAEGRPTPVFFSVGDVPVAGTRVRLLTRLGWLFKPRFVPRVQHVTRHVALEPREVVALAPVFSKLKSLVEAQPAQFPPVQSATRDAAGETSVPTISWKGRLATVRAVEPADAGRVLTRQNAILQTAIGVLLIFGGFGAAFLPPAIVSHLPGKPPDWLMGVAVIVMLLMFLLNLAWLLGGFPTYVTMRFMLRQTRRAFEGRLNPALDVNDPALVFVDIVPPINRGKQMMENASDIGLLKIDRGRRELIFEGDKERYWIPAESIVEMKHEYWADSVKHQLQSAPNLNHAILVRAMTPTGPWETWFYRRHHGFRPRTAKRRLNDSLELQRQIAALRDTR